MPRSSAHHTPRPVARGEALSNGCALLLILPLGPGPGQREVLVQIMEGADCCAVETTLDGFLAGYYSTMLLD